MLSGEGFLSFMSCFLQVEYFHAVKLSLWNWTQVVTCRNVTGESLQVLVGITIASNAQASLALRSART